MFSDKDEKWMRLALELAEKAAQQGEVPVGAVVVRADKLIGQGWNQPIGSHDPTAHAEVMALRHASATEQNYRIPGSTMYVTIEPCAMCTGAMIHARIDRLVFGAREPKAGAVVSQNALLEHDSVNTDIEVHEGVLADECSQMISDFFALRREQKKAAKKLKQQQLSGEDTDAQGQDLQQSQQ